LALPEEKEKGEKGRKGVVERPATSVVRHVYGKGGEERGKESNAAPRVPLEGETNKNGILVEEREKEG